MHFAKRLRGWCPVSSPRDYKGNDYIMHVVVCVKQVPDNTNLQLDPESASLLSQGLTCIANPSDLTALECALKLKDEFDARVTVISMGTPDTVQVLRQCLAFGADHAVLLADEALAGSDSFSTSYALSTVIQRLSQQDPVAIVICGSRSSDGAIGPSLARHLGWQQINSLREITEINLEVGSIIAVRALGHVNEQMRTKLPIVIAMAAEAPEIRYASLPNLLRALRYVPEIWSIADVDLDMEFIGRQGSPTRVKSIMATPRREVGQVVVVEDIGLEAAVATVVRQIG